MSNPELPKPGGIGDLILIGSGKGGVGKTTVSINLALALSQKGRKVALLDADIYGPDVPLLLGVRRTQEAGRWAASLPVLTSRPENAKPEIPSFERFGLRTMSIGFLIAESQTAQIGSDLAVGQLAKSLLYLVDWGDADTMIVDLPPGSDEPMGTIVKSTDVTGGILVTTPQDVARLDATRELKRFESVSLPVIGVVENMSYFECGHCGERQEVFSRGSRYTDLGAPIIGEVPLDAEASALANSGVPVMASETESPAKAAFGSLADEVVRRL